MSAETTAPVEPVRKHVRVARTVEDAFDLFVHGFERWWPSEIHSRAAHDQYGPGVTVDRVVFEPRVGGRVYEITSDGVEGLWAEVTAFEAPHRLVLAWKPNDRPEQPTELEVRFEADGDGTVVSLEHRGWELLGARADQARTGYADGWRIPLERFAAAAAG